MALKKRLNLEDLLLSITVLFTLLYPFIITGIILYQDSKKEDKALQRINKVLDTLTAKNCKERIFELITFTEVQPSELKEMCSYTEGKKVKSKSYKVAGDEMFFKAEIEGGYLTVVGVWEEDKFKIVSIEYDKRR